ncbi:MAG: alpha/beta hydrolase [Bacteroidales bacterium]|nr:alpha/beta hydrolase [Bacteroidales bacterium]
MKKTLALLALATMLCAVPAVSAPKKKQPVKETKMLLLYPEGQNVDKGIVENGVEVTLGPGESNGCTRHEEINDWGDRSFIGDSARIYLYIPKKCNGQMVVVCPGGGYWIVSTKNEGHYAADYLMEKGIAVCVVYYRLPYGHWEVPLRDVQNAFRYCRAHAAEWGVKQIGVMGFSAGGHLAASASTLWTDEITRPDFSVLYYPVITFGALTHQGTHDFLIGKREDWDDRTLPYNEYISRMEQYNALEEKYSLQNRVNARTPPTLLLASTGDTTVPVENSIMYYDALRRCGVRAEMHLYANGNHGWGFTTLKFWDKDYMEKDRDAVHATLFHWLESIRK